jgi:Flp pilus assembly protein TadD
MKTPAWLPVALFTVLFATRAFANDTTPDPAPLPNADLELGRTAIKAKDWKVAVGNLKAAVNYEPLNADAWNLLGYAQRNAGDYKNAFAAYERALKLDPVHRGAHEYLGEAYVLAGDKAMAEKQLAALERICGKSCTEYKDLAAAIAKAR